MKQSGGYIWVYSEPGRGTTFKIYLPRAEGHGEAVELSPSRTRKPPSAAGPRPSYWSRTKRAAQPGAELSGEQGYNVLEAADGTAAMRLRATHQGPIQLLLTDVIMPGMNGRELADRITELRPAMKVLYMSGYTENAIGHNGVLEAGSPAPEALYPSRLKSQGAGGARTQHSLRRFSWQLVPFAHPHLRSREKVSPFRAQRFNFTCR